MRWTANDQIEDSLSGSELLQIESFQVEVTYDGFLKNREIFKEKWNIAPPSPRIYKARLQTHEIPSYI